MKQIFLSLFLISSLLVQATIRTVSNNPNTLAQFSTIQAAVNASVSGDTILVHGGPTRYAGFTITDKRLTIIGPGWSPVQNFAPYKATVDDITITGLACKNTEIQGLDVFTNVSLGTNHPDSLRFIRNQFEGAIYFGGTGNYNGYTFQGNWFDEAWMSCTAGVSLSNFLFQNNVFYAISTNGNAYNFTNTQSVLFDHNLWYGPSGVNTAPCFGGSARYMLFTNNIFVHRNAATNNTYSTFNNNITFGAGVNNPWDTAYLNNGAGNVANQDPQMVNQTAVNNGQNDPLLDFTISDGPANNTGTDLKDMGLLYDNSGSLNWTNSRMSRIPLIYNMSIANPTLPAGSNLNVTVEARRNN